MRFLSTIKKKKAEGFTLVEVLIIAPIVIIAISGFIGLIIVMVGDVLAVRDKNNMSYEIRDTLDKIEQDTRLSTQFLTTSSTLQSPQGSDNNFAGTAAFTNTNGLILGTLTTDKNPTDSTRQLVYYAKQPNDCASALIGYNRPFIGKIIYFVKNGSLWKRTYLLPSNTTAPPNDETVCANPWQQNTCNPGYAPATRCQTNDSELMQNLDSINVKYFSTPSSTTDIGAANALSATSIEVTLNGKKTIAGRSVTNSGTVRINKLNNIDADLPLPTTPAVTAAASGTTNQVNFSWPVVPSATSYLISYNVNGGSWIDAINDSFTTSYSVTAYRNDTVTIRVTAKNSTGSSPYGQGAATMPAWNTPNLVNGWTSFNFDNYSTPGYTRTSAGVVVLKGVIKDGNATAQTELFTLPPGFRPAEHQLFQTDSAGNPSRIDIQSTGKVVVDRGSASWIVLDGIRFVPSDTSYTWTGASFQNGWQNYGFGYSTFGTTLDSLGRVHMRGLIKGGTYTNPTIITNLPAGQQAPEYTHVPASSNVLFNYTAFSSLIHAKGIGGSSDYYATQAMYYPTTTGWTPLTLQNGWVLFDAGHTQPRYRKAADNIVTVKGLIKNGNTAGDTIIAQLPAGFRPKERLCIAGVAGASHSRIDIQPDGRIIVAGYVNSGWTSLDNISFIAEQ